MDDLFCNYLGIIKSVNFADYSNSWALMLVPGGLLCQSNGSSPASPAPIDLWVYGAYCPFENILGTAKKHQGGKGKHISAGTYSNCTFIMSEEVRDLRRFHLR